MNCVEYEAALARLMAAAPADEERTRLLASMGDHAEACDECHGSRALLDLLSRPAGERDLAADPGGAYWEGFEERLSARLGGEAPAARARGVRRWWAAAAAAVLLLIVGWVFRPTGEPEVADRTAGGTGQADHARPDLPPELVLSVDRASVAELEDELAALESWGMGSQRSGPLGTQSGLTGWDAELFPDVEHLDTETRERLLEWLRRQNTSPEGA